MKKILMLILGLSFLSFSCSDDDDDDSNSTPSGTYNLVAVEIGNDNYTPLEYAQLSIDDGVKSIAYTTTFFDTDSMTVYIKVTQEVNGVDVSIEDTQRGTYKLISDDQMETKLVQEDGTIETEITSYDLDGNNFEVSSSDEDDDDDDGDVNEEVTLTFQK